MMEPGPRPNEEFEGSRLHQAALSDNLELLQQLISSGEEVNAVDGHGRSPLHAAALTERSRCLIALCHNGVNIDTRSDSHTGNKIALHVATECGHTENVRTLLTAGADLTVQDATAATALAIAHRLYHTPLSS